MRTELKKMNGVRQRFQATVKRFGRKRAYKGPDLPTVLLVDVRALPEGNVVADHLWLTCGRNWQGIAPGDKVEFNARVGEYEKGYKGHRDDVYCPITRDYRLERPTKVSKVFEGIEFLRIIHRSVGW